HPAAALSVGAHLIKLSSDGRVEVAPDPRWDDEVVLR
ncbi:MAG: hypothetical protein GWN79_08070, partial [Actinobacteria bacterium]|nr:hypothetical protein [Actinomycetota bacterium]NIU19042.1 hypothetical protein [Actinomycetota bacterium]NIU66077.1 hypothetical protein [Actinomycetota bacterium]NIW27881.1 hypothetical protein [Actinomycetota bacterium]NIX20386.1 hypothetical protein [Actinomycetota bacterium]